MILHLRTGASVKVVQMIDLRIGQLLERHFDLVAEQQLRLQRLQLRKGFRQSFDIGPRNMQLHAHVRFLLEGVVRRSDKPARVKNASRVNR